MIRPEALPPRIVDRGLLLGLTPAQSNELADLAIVMQEMNEPKA